MLWLWLYFAAFIIVHAHYFYKKYQLNKKPASVPQSDPPYFPPSDALIDFALPQEIKEQILSLLDARSFYSLQWVSKHWRFISYRSHKMFEQIQLTSIDNDRKELTELLTSVGVFLPKNIWISHEANHLKKALVCRSIAQKEGKKLLYVRGSALIPLGKISVLRKISDQFKQFDCQTVVQATSVSWTFFLREPARTQVIKTDPLPNVKWARIEPSKSDVEIRFNLWQFIGAQQRFGTVQLSYYRPLDPIKRIGFYASGPMRNFIFEVVLLWFPWLAPYILIFLSNSPLVYIIGYIWLFISAKKIYDGKRNNWKTNLVLAGNIAALLLRHYFAYEYSLVYHAHVIKTVPMLYFGLVWYNYQESNLTRKRHKRLVTISMIVLFITAIHWFNVFDSITTIDFYENLLKSFVADLMLFGDIIIIAYLWYSYAVGHARISFVAYLKRYQLSSLYWSIVLTVFGSLWIHLATHYVQ